MKRHSRVTIKDVARRAGVSVATVSKVINNRYGVAEETYARVQAVIDELGYETSLVAQSLRSHQTNVIGILVVDLEPFSTELLKGAAKGMHDTGFELVVYSDFQCPHCKALDASLRQLRRRPLIRIVQEPYPLDQTCNPHARITKHPGACLQALASLCADEQGRGQTLNDRLFDEGAKERAALIASAASLGIDRGRFEDCLQSPAVAARLRDVIDGAAARQVRATPTLFVNGRRHDGAVRPSDLSCLLSVPDRPSRNTVPPR